MIVIKGVARASLVLTLLFWDFTNLVEFERGGPRREGTGSYRTHACATVMLRVSLIIDLLRSYEIPAAVD